MTANTTRSGCGNAVAALAIAAGLTACGGGGEGAGSASDSGTPSARTPVAGEAQGIYRGSMADGRELYIIVLENDQFYAMYGATAGNSFAVSGVVQGDGASNNGSFSSSNAVDTTSLGTLATASVTASYVLGASLNGSVTESSGAATFSTTPVAPTVVNYNSRANLADVTGTWSLTSLRGYPNTFVIAADGSFTASSEGCSFSGTFTPRASDKNVFDVVMTFGPAPCKLPNAALKGAAIEYLLTNGQHQLIVAGIDTSRKQTAAFFGVR